MKRLGATGWTFLAAALFAGIPIGLTFLGGPRPAVAAPALLTWGVDKSVSPANVCLYYTSTNCFNIGTMSAGGQFVLPLANIQGMAAESVVANPLSTTAAPTASQLPYSAPQGRITLTSGVPILINSVTGGTTVYYTPSKAGNLAPTPNVAFGGYVMHTFPELSQLTTDATKSPAAVAANSCYDILLWEDPPASGTLRATRGPAWTNCTTRGASAGLTRNRGLFLNTNNITNGPAAGMGVWVGAVSSNAGSTIDYIFGGAGSGGVNSRLEVCNAYNRELITTQVIDTGAGYTYSSATIRQARGAATMQVSALGCASSDTAVVAYQTECATVATATQGCDVGMGFDTTTVFSLPRMRVVAPTAAVHTAGQMQSSTWLIGLGVHVLSANESSVGASANTFNNVGFGELTLTINH